MILTKEREAEKSLFEDFAVPDGMGPDGFYYTKPERTTGNDGAYTGYFLGAMGDTLPKWKDWKKFKKDHPLIKENPLNLIKVPIYTGIGKIIDAINIDIPNRNSLLTEYVGGMLDAYSNGFMEKARAVPLNVCPRLRIYMSYAENPSAIEHMYTVKRNGLDIPIHFSMKENEPIPADTLRENIKEFIDHADRTESPYDNLEEGRNFMNKDFLRLAIEWYSRLDYKYYFAEEPTKYFRALVKDTGGFIRHQGERDFAKEAQLPADLKTGTSQVFIYKTPCKKSGLFYKAGKFLMNDDSPRSGKAFLYNVVGGLINQYMLSGIFDPLLHTFKGLGVSEEGLRNFAETKYKIQTRIRRSLYDEFDMTYSLN